MKTIGVDVGDTFTNLIYLDFETGNLGIHKVATPRMVSENPALTLMSGLAEGVIGGGWIGPQC
ncbi:MAG: hypothetical protein AAF252_07490 [Pseudomonadota bacterium]